MTIAIVVGLVVLAVIAAIWIASYVKAKQLKDESEFCESEPTSVDMPDTTLTVSTSNDLCAPEVESVTVSADSVEETLLTELNDQCSSAPECNESTDAPAESTDAPAEVAEAPAEVAEVADKKVRKPRRTPLERTDDAIAKLDGQIFRRTALLKQLKKPITKDERLNKWKTQLKQFKENRKALVKAAKTPKTKKLPVYAV